MTSSPSFRNVSCRSGGADLSIVRGRLLSRRQPRPIFSPSELVACIDISDHAPGIRINIDITLVDMVPVPKTSPVESHSPADAKCVSCWMGVQYSVLRLLSQSVYDFSSPVHGTAI
jgi:hypothetical protein